MECIAGATIIDRKETGSGSHYKLIVQANGRTFQVSRGDNDHGFFDFCSRRLQAGSAPKVTVLHQHKRDTLVVPAQYLAFMGNVVPVYATNAPEWILDPTPNGARDIGRAKFLQSHQAANPYLDLFPAIVLKRGALGLYRSIGPLDTITRDQPANGADACAQTLGEVLDQELALEGNTPFSRKNVRKALVIDPHPTSNAPVLQALEQRGYCLVRYGQNGAFATTRL